MERDFIITNCDEFRKFSLNGIENQLFINVMTFPGFSRSTPETSTATPGASMSSSHFFKSGLGKAMSSIGKFRSSQKNSTSACAFSMRVL